MGIADAILDLVSSGTTLRENNLKEIEGGVVLESQVTSSISFLFLQFSRMLSCHLGYAILKGFVFRISCLTFSTFFFRLF